jgi:hypothetical protein
MVVGGDFVEKKRKSLTAQPVAASITKKSAAPG